jgi:hypothetical protein
MKSILVPSKVFVTADAATKEKLKEIVNKAIEQKMIVLAFYFKNGDVNGDVLAIVARARDDYVFEVRLVDAELKMIDWFSTNSDKMFFNEIDVLKDARIAGSVRAYWILAKMRAFKERTKKTVLAYFYNTDDEQLYALTATEYFVNLENITGILWDP